MQHVCLGDSVSGDQVSTSLTDSLIVEVTNPSLSGLWEMAELSSEGHASLAKFRHGTRLRIGRLQA